MPDYDRVNWKATNPNEPYENTPANPLGIGLCVIFMLVALLGSAWAIEAILRLIYGG